MRYAPLNQPLVWQAYLIFWICGSLAVAWPIPAFTAAAILFCLDQRLWTFQRAFLSLLAIFTAFAWTANQFRGAENMENDAHTWTNFWHKDGGKRFYAKIIRVQGLSDHRLRILLSDVEGDGEKERLPGFCAWTWEKPPYSADPLPGQRVSLNRPIRQIHDSANDPEEARDASWFAQEIYWRAYSKAKNGEPIFDGAPGYWAQARNNIRWRFMEALLNLGQDQKDKMAFKITQGQAILPALLFGDKFYLNQGTVDNFGAATLAHSLALSGQHLCVAGLIGMFAILGVARARPGIYLRSSRGILIAIAALPPAFLYLWIGNAPASLLRAVCMLSIFAIWLWRRNVFNGVDILCAALFIILLLNPLAIYDIGLQLSALCLAVLTLSAPAFNAFFARNKPQTRNFLMNCAFRAAQILAVSLLIQIALLPITLSRFHMAGFWFPLNMLWLPLLGLITLPLGALGLLVAQIPGMMIVAHPILQAACLPCQFIVWLLEKLHKAGLLYEPAFLLPHWSVFIAFAVLIAALSWLLGNRRTFRVKSISAKLLLLVLCLLAIGPALRVYSSFDNTLRLEALDVGQGQAIFIHFPGNGRMLVDAGGSWSNHFDVGKNIISPILSTNQAPRLNAAINSHPDLDHLGGFFYLLDHYNVEAVFHNGGQANKKFSRLWKRQQAEHNAAALRAGDEIVLGKKEHGLKLEVLHPTLDNEWTGNDASLILRLTRHGEGLALIPGDAGIQPQTVMITKKLNLCARIVIAPHHGSDKNFVPEFYRAANPSYTLVSCGYHNRWDFPGGMVSNWLRENNIPMLATSLKGKISVTFSPDGSFSLQSTRK